MKVLYNCFGGSHSSITAAAIHLGLLPSNRIPSNQEFLSVPYYDAQIAEDHGKIRFMGFDEHGNHVYITSKRNLGRHYALIISKIANIVNIDINEWIIVDTMPYVNLLMVIGGYTSRRLRWINIGRPIVIYGNKLSYFKFVHLVENVKYSLRRANFKQ